MLDGLAAADGIDWQRVEAFHLDEYVGLPLGHPSSFGRWLDDHIWGHVRPGRVERIDGGSADPGAESRRYGALLDDGGIDLGLIGIGENGHLAFNDPPVADFGDPRDVKVVELEAASRNQQVGEGHFANIDDVPTHAITVTIPALLRASRVLVIVPEARKAQPVYDALLGPITTACPASILRHQSHAMLYLDPASAGQLPE
jgi:glucosamine-6-phosphate deaminase